ncbi:MAG: cysteine--tRNA ligase [Promethearchaeota archaeon]
MTPSTQRRTPPLHHTRSVEAKRELKIYNTLTKRKELFKPLEPEKVQMYTCGLTVNYLMHIGHARTYIFWDVVERLLRYLHYDVVHISNVTDISVDDNILKRVRASGEAFQQLVTRHTRDYYYDRRLLGIADPYTYTVATQYIQEMIELVQQLLDKGYAYEAEDGIYFRISTFPDYGQLAGINPKQLKAGAGGRITQDEYDKESVGDFALWKRSKPDEPFWHSPWGLGRPGWHIECSAMSKKYLGDTIDISGGGEDNLFPHHENSIAQSEAASGKPYVRYWMHVRHLQFAGEKMSKSVGNILTVREAVKQYSGATLRLFLLSTHYRKPLTFNEEDLQRTNSQLDSLRYVLTRLHALKIEQIKPSSCDDKLLGELEKARSTMESALLDDFNTGRVINQLFQFVKHVNQKLEAPHLMSNDTVDKLLIFFQEIGTILFGDLYTSEVEPQTDSVIVQLVELLLQERDRLRQNQEYQQADAIRTALQRIGFEITDSKTSTQWWRKGANAE